ncbi:MAG: 50S ribosomal protein L1 [Gemmatales bacterium]|nr:50S ribosomal protein L1 [Gemmatales bacterium]MDW8386790.1 50S ribosomal protein L1 [Gemmatales bacterium]
MAKKQADKASAEPAKAEKEKAAPAPAEASSTKAEAKEKRKPSKTKAEAPPTPAPTEKTSPAAPPAETTAVAPEPTRKKSKAPGSAPPRGKKLKAQLVALKQKIRKMGPVSVRQAVQFLKENKRAKFDETVEIHMSLGIDPKQSDQMVRGAVALPHGIGKPVRLLVFAQGENATKAKEAGADYVGGEDLAKKILSENWTDFDVALATPDMMSVVGRLGKVLGPRGLMPTPKAGTVITGDVAAAVREFKAGKVEYRADAGGNVHAPVGKLSFDTEKLVGNINAFIEQIKAAKPAAAKGNYIKSITVSASMSPGVPVTA